MSTSAWVMFIIGAGIIWGGLIGSLFIAFRRSRKRNSSTKT